MSDSQEKSDDLIAELAKLMASSATGTEGPKPAVIKLPPLHEATVQATPVRIPGMEPTKPAPAPQPEPPRPAMTSAAPVRIPGMEKPAGIDTPPPAPRPASQFDFGRPPAAAPVIQPEPISNWETRAVPNLKLADPVPRPAAVQQLAAMKFDPVTPASAADAVRPDTKPVSVPPPPVPQSQAPMSTTPNTAPPGDGFNFDFGFSGGQGAPKQPPAAANDPIADLISAELDGEDEPEPIAPAPKAEVPPPVAVAVKPVVAQPRATAPAAIQIKPVSVAPRPAEGDRFAAAPAFGNKVPASSAPIPHISTARADDVDPMDEIESLIGEAVRVELNPADKPVASSPAPVVPPLNTAFGPRRSGLKDDSHVKSAEEAILAAASSGSDIDSVDSPTAEDRPYRRMKVKPPKTNRASGGARQYVGIAVAGTLLLAAGFGLYWVLGMGRDNPADAPVLTADADPVKVEPAVNAALAATPEPASVVFDEIDGTAAVDNGETLVSRDETEGETVTEVARVVEPEDDAETASGLANRKVRTVTVRPDGTIVSGDDAVAGAELLPVDRPDVPEIPGAEPIETAGVALDAVTVATDATAEPDPIAALVSDTGPATATAVDTPEPVEVASVDPASIDSTPPTFDASIVAPIPMPRPIDRSGMVGGTSRTAAVQLDPAPVEIGANSPASTPLVAIAQDDPAPAATASRGGAFVQVGSLPSESDARSQVRSQQARFGSLFEGGQLEVMRVDLGAKGIWYRVILPVSSFRQATQICASIEANGGDCIANAG